VSVKDRHKAVENFVMAYVQMETPATCVMDYRCTIMAAVLALVLEVHDEACSICYQQTAFGRAACDKRARLAAMGKEGE
jgi:hypothetical protein